MTARGTNAPPQLYVPDGYDEALDASGRPRGSYEGMLATLAEQDLEELAARLRAHCAENGIDFRVPGGSREFHLDVVPRIVTAAEWAELERGLLQRARALNEFAADAYGEQWAVRDGVVPERLIETSQNFEPDMVGVEVQGPHASVIGFDVVRGADGLLRVLEDNAMTPSGIAYAIAARSAIDAIVPLKPPGERRDVAAGVEQLAAAIRAAAPPGAGGEPRAALLSDGPENSAWYEHRDLAGRLDISLLTPERVEQRDGRLWGAAEGEVPRPLDVVYRRTAEGGLRGRDGKPTWVAEALLEPVRRGALGMVNAFGGSVADDKLTHVYVEELIRYYLGEEPVLSSVPGFDLGIEEQRAEALERIDELVVKPRAESGGEGVVIAEQEGESATERIAARVRSDPEAFVAQETVRLSTHPTACDGRLEPRHIDLRAFAIGDEIVPGGLTRVALGAGELIVNSSQDGGAKDTWVLR
ncbi:MAG: circularly permuted type 2 ATP-grasp protein [Solirubrobacterales bacterium]